MAFCRCGYCLSSVMLLCTLRAVLVINDLPTLSGEKIFAEENIKTLN